MTENDENGNMGDKQYRGNDSWPGNAHAMGGPD